MVLDGASYRVFFTDGKISLSKTPSVDTDESAFSDLIVVPSKNIVKITNMNSDGFSIISEQTIGKDSIRVSCGDITKVIEAVVYETMNKIEINPATYFSYPLLNR